MAHMPQQTRGVQKSLHAASLPKGFRQNDTFFPTAARAKLTKHGTAPLPKHAQLGVDGFELFFVFLRISFLEGAPLRGRLQSCHMKSAGGGVASVGRLTCLCTSEEGGVARRGEGSPREGRSGSNERQVKKCQALNATLPHCRSLRQRLFNVGLAARVKFLRENISSTLKGKF